MFFPILAPSYHNLYPHILIMKRYFLFLSLVFATIRPVYAQCWSQVSGGGYHAVALKSDGSLWAWGKNVSGQLGDGTFEDKTTPAQIGSNKNWLMISAGNEHTMAIKNDGTLWAWGENTYGQLGDSTYISSNLPKQIGTDTDWKYVSAGSIFTLALKEDGSLWSWGWNDHYELGTGNTESVTFPTHVGEDTDWQMVSASTLSATAIKTDHSIWSWGANVEGSLGAVILQFQEIPAQIGANVFDYGTTSSGGFTSMNIKTDGTIWGWGFNAYGTVGNGSSSNVRVPVRIGSDSDWVQAVTSTSITRGIKENGQLWVWGKNDIGQLGDGTTINKNSPVLIEPDKSWKSVSGRREFTIAIDSNNALWAWGDNSYGQLGDGTRNDKTTPVAISSNCQLMAQRFSGAKISLQLYPNPVNDILFIDNSEKTPIDFYTITDMTGKKVTEHDGSVSAVNLQELPAGIYIFQAFSGSSSFQSKFVKQ
ncbi:Por secretion system C-terminal sorting domain-containing protein [Flavobacterium noncentrifugens]|uniref:Por secretion system C-terminal sorting domain-containing protein n=2 Tax=Flavobacterium noncentrifugens TaxID=1128970 RepID=A0A1G8VF96_9FLAO|nr:Por secretion system C-terminal sorting domain-containing protein [Flavobacterium noncentrifugens]